VNSSPSRLRRNIAALSLVAAGVAGGGVLASTVAANAADSATSTATASPAAPDSGTATQRPAVDESKSQRADEHLLTGTDAEKATAAALAKYPGATIQRVETDSDGVYEAHLVTADGQRLTVEMDKSFAVTGLESNGGPGAGGYGNGAGGYGSGAPATGSATTG
jgi:uncharacterized membrane protein YkoI